MQIFVNWIERLNSPVYSAAPCIYCISEVQIVTKIQ